MGHSVVLALSIIFVVALCPCHAGSWSVDPEIVEHPWLWNRYVVSKYHDPVERSKVVGLREELLDYRKARVTVVFLCTGVWVIGIALLLVKNRRAPKEALTEHFFRLASPLGFAGLAIVIASIGEFNALLALSKGEGYRVAVETIRAYGVYGPAVIALLAIAVILVTVSRRAPKVDLPFLPKTGLPLSRVSAIIAWTSVLLTSALIISYTVELFSR
ncbi:hypothetical protein [Methanopyrus kandleri]|uniref:Predicted membrane protein n=2 Tax=Methanopyrus kandleri TaxID=2320 RepID=Q8TW85_METKA|nr:hypothetical protein [Methanopyrus kandleri]AAM02364.1 Predicted membrane protein [Methanopyrus kandleri AV19]HII69789.1 hypothetical protein [Methanopyrus kandleri]